MAAERTPIYGTQAANVGDRSIVSKGPVGSGNYVEVGALSQVLSNVESTGGVLLRGSFIDGDVFSGTSVQQQPGTDVTGVVEDGIVIPVVPIPTKSFTSGTTNHNIYSGQSLDLPPGQYGEIHLYSNGTLTLESGTYSLKKLIIEAPGANLTLDVTQGAIEANTESTLRFGNNLNMSLVGGDDPKLVQFYTNSQENVVIGTDMTFSGEISAPYAEVVVYSRVDLNGSIHAHRVLVDTDVNVTSEGCEESSGNDLPRGLDNMTHTVSIWWPDYHPNQLTTVDSLRFSVENTINHAYLAVGKIRYYGPQGTEWNATLGQHYLTPGQSATFSIPANTLPIQSETSVIQAQPEIILKRADVMWELTDDEKRLVPPIFYQHVAGTGFGQIQLFDEATLISEKDGKMDWGTGETVSPGDLLGYITGTPIHAGQGEQAKLYNELGEVIGYKLGRRRGSAN